MNAILPMPNLGTQDGANLASADADLAQQPHLREPAKRVVNGRQRHLQVGLRRLTGEIMIALRLSYIEELFARRVRPVERNIVWVSLFDFTILQTASNPRFERS